MIHVAENTPNTAPDIECLLEQQTHVLHEILHKYLEQAVIGKFSEDRIPMALRGSKRPELTGKRRQGL